MNIKTINKIKKIVLFYILKAAIYEKPGLEYLREDNVEV
jgi:hypothetical protein